LATSLPLVPSQRPHRGHTRKLLGDREFVLEGGVLLRRPARGPRASSRGAQAQSRGGSCHFVVEARPPWRRKPAACASALDAAVWDKQGNMRGRHWRTSPSKKWWGSSSGPVTTL